MPLTPTISGTPLTASYKEMANAIRALSMDAVQRANSGHPGMPMGMADVASVLFTDFLKYDPTDPHWPNRDRFVLSAGHGSMLIYSLLFLTGYSSITKQDIKDFRQLGAKTAGHPEYGHADGIETTTGPLGQGIANAVGMAMAEKLSQARHGKALVDHFTYAIAGDGCLMEGISHEAIDLAGHLKLSKLIVLWDDNSITIDGDTAISTSMDQRARFEAAGWDVIEIDGHDPAAIKTALNSARNTDKPSMIACKTIIGFGAPNKQGTEKVHGAALGDEEVAAARKTLGWDAAPFEIPDEILSAWRSAGAQHTNERKTWEAAAAGVNFDIDLSGLDATITALKNTLATDKPKIATRKASKITLDALIPAIPAMIGGSADLTGSNLTKADGQKPIIPEDFSGSYVYYGVREHAMAAAMNGIALHSEFIPYGGTFLVFADYCRPAIRMAALMHKRAIYVMTHDSIGLGEDGPTHQPVEHIASLRAMPNVNVIRPADAMETAESWECALRCDTAPSILCLSRQGLPALRDDASTNKTALGAYVLSDADGPRDVTLIATGSEVSITLEAAVKLRAEGISVAVVSMPCWEFFEVQSLDYQQSVLGKAPIIAIEAGIDTGWHKWIGRQGVFVGMKGFGASGPAPDVYKHFGITVDTIANVARIQAKAS